MATEKTLRVVVGARTSDFDKAMKSLQRDLRSFSRDMTTIGRDLTMKVTAPIAGLGVAAFNVGKDFEKSMSQIVGLVGVAQDQVDAWSKDLLQMGPALGKGPKELAEALFFITSAGIRGAEAMDVLESSAKASVGGLGETKVIADLVTSAMNAYGSETLSASQATDILVAAVREGKAEAPDLAASMGMVLPIASEMGMTFDQVAAAVAAMTRTGTDASTANTQLRQVLASLLKPTSEAEKTLKAFGLTSSDLRKLLREEGLISLLTTLKETFGDNEEAMSKVFGNIRALSGVLDLTGANVADNIKIFDALKDSTGSLDGAFEAASDTAEFKWNRALAQVQASLVSLWQVIEPRAIPVVEKFTEKIADLTGWFNELDPRAQQTLVDIAAAVAAIGPTLWVIGALAGSLNNLITLLMRLKAINIEAVLTGWLGPIGLVTAAIWGLSQGIKAVVDQTTGARTKWSDDTLPQGLRDELGPLSNDQLFNYDSTMKPFVAPPTSTVKHFGGLSNIDNLATQKQTVTHTGTIRVEGVNNKGELVDIVETTVNDVLRREVRR